MGKTKNYKEGIKIRKKVIFLLVVFLLPVIFPVNVDSAITVWIDITNPFDGESFDYFTTTEVFTANVVLSGLGIGLEYNYQYAWYIDTVEIDSDFGSDISSAGGQITLIGEITETIVNISSYDSGEHIVALEIILFGQGDIYIAQEIHNHVFFREVDPNATSTTATTPTNNESWIAVFWATWYGKTAFIGGGSLLLILGYFQLKKEKVVVEDEE